MSGKAIDIIKRSPKRGSESFQRNKLHRSIHAACLSVRCRPGEAEDIATQVCEVVLVWLDDKPEVTSADLRRITAARLKRFHPDAAYLYEHQNFTL